MKPIEESERDFKDGRQTALEKEEMQETLFLNDGTVFDGENEVFSFIQEIMLSILLMSIIARILSAFEHRMKVEEKRNCVSLIYPMPLIFLGHNIFLIYSVY